MPLPNGRSIVVRETIVRPQPMGSYIDPADHIGAVNAVILAKKEKVFAEKGRNIAAEALKDIDDLIGKCVLVVDPGEYTLDWLFKVHRAINTKASGAASDSGRNRIVNAVKWSMEIDLGEPIPPVMMSKLDAALRNGTPLKLNGLQFDLEKYKPAIDQEVSDVLNGLYQGLRGLEGRIDLIVLVGGHPDLYERHSPSASRTSRCSSLSSQSMQIFAVYTSLEKHNRKAQRTPTP
jgi:plasmid segregation protein ParM